MKVNFIKYNLILSLIDYYFAGQLTSPSLTYDGPSLTLTCTTSGGPPTTITWLRDGTPIVIDNMTYRQSQTVVNMGMATYETTLTTDALSGLVGIIQCIASNARGSVSSNNISVSGMNYTCMITLDLPS